MDIQENLQKFYDSEATKYAQTRKKPWKEAKMVLDIVKDFAHKHKKTKILELGCGSGRFVQQKGFEDINKNYVIDYTGIDISSELLVFAKKSFPSGKFMQTDMLQFMKEQKQESIDIILAFASFQHIDRKIEREVLMHYFYQTLNYGGIVLMTNRAFSKWFRNTYFNNYKKSLWKYLYSFGKFDWKDIYVPWSGKNKKFLRFYHMFSLKELKTLAEQAGFIIEKVCYIDKKGQEIDNRKFANNSFIFLKKGVHISNP